MFCEKSAENELLIQGHLEDMDKSIHVIQDWRITYDQTRTLYLMHYQNADGFIMTRVTDLTNYIK